MTDKSANLVPDEICSQSTEQMISWILEPTFDELQRLGSCYKDGGTEEACEAFTAEVTVHETSVRLAYRNVVKCLKRTSDLDEISKTWDIFLVSIDRSLDVVRDLKERFPYCGTPELYNNLLDYRSAAKKRRDYAIEEKNALKEDFPDELIATV